MTLTSTSLAVDMDCDEVKCENGNPNAGNTDLRTGTTKTRGKEKDTTLRDSLAGFWKSRMYADVRVECGEGGVVDCHMIVLSALSSMVAEALEANEKDADVPVIIVPDINAMSLETFLSNVYYGGSGEAIIPEELNHIGFSLKPIVRKPRVKGSSTHFSSNVKSEPFDSDDIAPEELGFDPMDVVDNDFGIYRRAKASKRKMMGKRIPEPLWHKDMNEVDGVVTAQQVEVDIKQEDDDVEFKFDDVDDDTSGAEGDDHEGDPDYRKPASVAQRSRPLRGGRKRTSPVWEFFTTVEKELNKCNICDAVVRSVKQNTTNMMKHLTTNHPSESSSLVATVGDRKIKTEVKNEEGSDSGTGGNSARRTYSPRKRKSMVWQHFSRVDNVSTKCQLCSRVMVTRTGSTTSMMKHLKGNHQAEYRALFAEMGLDLPKEEAAAKGKTYGPLKKRGPKAQYDDDPKHRTCPDCKKEYSCRQAMLYHVKVVHSGVRPFCCQECGMTFARADSFRGHSHSLERTFLCSVCGKTFARRNIRDVHERAHYNDRRYPCSFCEKKFMTNQQKR